MGPRSDTRPLPRGVLLRGEVGLPPEKTLLRAGELACVLESGSLRCFRLGSLEVLRMVYAAVRDRNWDTVPAVLSRWKLEVRERSFEVSYFAEHRDGAIDFAWTGTIRGEPDGTIRFAMDGEARSTFLRNRIGFCVLHPSDECAGKPCVVEKVDGSVERGAFPRWISPGAPFKDIVAITHEIAPGLEARVAFEGEVFEMEDQRNWTDASYKTFCTPLAIPFPIEVKVGTKIAQAVTVKVTGPAASAATLAAEPRDARTVITLDAAKTTRLPRIGLGTASHQGQLTRSEVHRLQALHLAHLRVDLKMPAPDRLAALRQAATDAAGLGVELEVALHLSSNAARELEELASALEELRPAISSFLIFPMGEKVTPAPLVRLAREALLGAGSVARIGGGTDADFVEINRKPAPLGLLDFVCYAVNPQVHACDDDSLVEALSGQRSTVESARRLCGGLPLAITPVTLKQRFNPNATGPPRQLEPCELPPQVDARQMSLFGAAWTVGSLTSLLGDGVESITLYETTGWRGVLETETGSPDPRCFPSLPGAVFPLYHVLADAGEMRGGEVVATSSSRPLKARALALRRGRLQRVLVANLSPEAQVVELAGLEGAVRVRQLDETSSQEAMTSPEAYRAAPACEMLADRGSFELTLRPFGVARADIDPPSRR